MGEDGFDGFVLEIRRVAVLSEDAFDHDFDLGSRALKARPLLRIRYGAEGPVDRHGFADLCDQFGGDDFQFVVAHGFDGRLVGGQGIVEWSRWGASDIDCIYNAGLMPD